MGLLSISVILLSLTCLAVLMGLVLAVILIWPHKSHDSPDSQTEKPGQPDRPHTDQE